jgi:hypothetical protein
LIGVDPNRKFISTVTLDQLNHAKTLQLLVIAGILRPNDPMTPVNETLDDYKDRGPKKPWNDGWGNPLVVAYGIFQPSDSLALGVPGTVANAGKQVQQALELFQYNRSIYLTIGAPGPFVQNSLDFSTLATADTAITNIWTQVTNVCSANTWTEASFDHPPWQGVKRGKKTIAGREYKSLLSSPLEFR